MRLLDRALPSVGAKLGLVVAVLLTAAAYLLLQWLEYERERSFADRAHAVDQVADQLALSLAAPLEFDDDTAINDALATFAHDADVRFLEVTDADRPDATTRMGTLPSLPPTGDADRLHRDDELVWIRHPITDDAGSELGRVSLGVSLATAHAAWAQQRDLILLVCAAFGGLLTIGVVGTTRAVVLRPLAHLASAADRLARGGAVEVEVTSHDEVGRLAAAFNHMSAAIRDRESGLARAHAEAAGMLDGMRHALFSFGADLRIDGRSSRASATVFGREIGGLDVRDVLLEGIDAGAPERHAAEAFLEAAFGIDVEQWPAFAALAPREFRGEPGGELRELEVDFTPLVEAGRVTRLMAVVWDDTEARRSQRRMQELHERLTTEGDALRRLLGVGVQAFADLEHDALRRLALIESLADDPDDDVVVTQVFRLVHTLRGGARALGLVELAAALQDAELLLAPVRDALRARSRIPPNWRGELLHRIARAREALAQARRRLVEASPLGEAVFERVTVSATDLARVLAARDRVDPETRHALDRLAARPLADLLTGLEDAVDGWARRDGKCVRLAIVGAAARVDRARGPALHDAIAALVRNAIAHGIEAPEERAHAGKPQTGTIAIRCSDGEHGAVVHVVDDGRGVPVAQIRRDVEALGKTHDPAFPFADGISTRAGSDELAGRGIGLVAIRGELERVGYHVRLVETTEGGTTFALEPFAA